MFARYYLIIAVNKLLLVRVLRDGALKQGRLLVPYFVEENDCALPLPFEFVHEWFFHAYLLLFLSICFILFAAVVKVGKVAVRFLLHNARFMRHFFRFLIAVACLAFIWSRSK